MARGVNRVTIIGNLGQDPEVRYMPNGNAVANVTVATSEEWKDQQGQQQSRVEWHRIVMYKRLAEIAGEYLRKGSKVYLEGKLQTREWQDQQGQKRYTTEIVCHEMQMLDGKQAGAGTGAPAAPAAQRPAQQQPQQQSGGWGKPQGGPAGTATQGGQPQYQELPMDFDDDIPF